jgi:hypothetical protein
MNILKDDFGLSQLPLAIAVDRVWAVHSHQQSTTIHSHQPNEQTEPPQQRQALGVEGWINPIHVGIKSHVSYVSNLPNESLGRHKNKHGSI